MNMRVSRIKADMPIAVIARCGDKMTEGKIVRCSGAHAESDLLGSLHSSPCSS
jgi:hypothetical protein